MELLISGFVLVLLIQSFSQLNYLQSWLSFTISNEFFQLVTSLISDFLLPTSIIALIIIFSLNLAARGYWIAIIGLMSRYEESSENTKFSANRKQNIMQLKQVGRMKRHLDFVDHIGSQVFAAGFLLVCYLASVTISISQIIIILYCMINFLSDVGIVIKIVALIFILTHILCLLIFFVDVFTNGFFSKRTTTWINRTFFFIYNYNRLLTGFSLYEKVALSGRKGKLSTFTNMVFLLVFSVLPIQHVSAFVDGFQNGADELVPNNIVYLSEHTKKGLLFNVAIDQREYHKMPIKIFVPLKASIEQELDKFCEAQKLTLSRDLCIDEFFDVFINDKTIAVGWVYETHKIGKTKGITMYIDEPELKRGQHTLTISLAQELYSTYFWYYP